jgi:hypothetical protein
MKTGCAMPAKKTGARIIAEIAQALTKNTLIDPTRTTKVRNTINQHQYGANIC